MASQLSSAHLLSIYLFIHLIIYPSIHFLNMTGTKYQGPSPKKNHLRNPMKINLQSTNGACATLLHRRNDGHLGDIRSFETDPAGRMAWMKAI